MRVLIAGGGTGGHLFPGIAVAEELLERDPDTEVTFVGTRKGIEYRVLPNLGWPLKLLDISGLKTVGILGALRGLMRIPRSCWQSYKIIREYKPDVALGVGGFASGPLVLVARLCGVRCAVLEQNSIPGLTNKILGRLVHRVFLTFEASRCFFPPKTISMVGNPIRASIRKSLNHAENSPEDLDVFRIFVFGGSQGAHAVNQLLTEAVRAMQDDFGMAIGSRVRIVHQTGASDLEPTQAAYEALGAEVECHAFIDDMASRYSWADVVVARAGATSIAELGVVGKAAIFIPYPYAAQNHQEHNAKEMVEAGAAIVCSQNETTGSDLATKLKFLIDNPHKRLAMAAAMAAFGNSDAAARVASWCRQDPNG